MREDGEQVGCPEPLKLFLAAPLPNMPGAMSTQHDVRRLALALPDVVEDVGHFGFSLIIAGKRKGLAWAWRERIDPRKPRVASSTVIAIRVADAGDKRAILASDTKKFFTEPHYDGYPAVLVRLRAIGVRELGRLLAGAWRCQAPKERKRAKSAGGTSEGRVVRTEKGEHHRATPRLKPGR